MLQRHYQVITDEATGFKQVHWKPKRELARAGEGIESPYDIEARYRSRYGIGWTGYMVHLSETCDDDQCHLITNVMTTTAAVHEAKCTQDIHQSLLINIMGRICGAYRQFLLQSEVCCT